MFIDVICLPPKEKKYYIPASEFTNGALQPGAKAFLVCDPPLLSNESYMTCLSDGCWSNYTDCKGKYLLI